MTTVDRGRLTLEVSPEMRRILDRLTEQTGTDQAEVLRQAIALLKFIKDAKANGDTPALVNKDGAVTTEIVGV